LEKRIARKYSSAEKWSFVGSMIDPAPIEYFGSVKTDLKGI